MAKERVGFIGLGFMGHGMAGNILAKGWPLTVMAHRNRAPADDLVARGAAEAANPKEVAAASDVVILCVTGSPEVQAIIQGPDGLAAAGKQLVIIDCSTSDPSVTTRLAAELAPLGMTLIDAPLGRTPAEALAGTLDVMVGGRRRCRGEDTPAARRFRGAGRTHGADRHRPHDEAPQQLPVDGLRGPLFRGLGSGRQGGADAGVVR